MQSGLSLLSDDLRDELRKINSSIVGIGSVIKYRIYQYNYMLENGQVIPDATSPLRYKIQSGQGENGITVEEDEKTLSGGGLIIDFDRENSTYTILTSSHLVKPKDTTNVYYSDEEGNPTDILFAKYVVKDVMVTVRGRSHWRVRAEVITHDPINDLAVIEAKTTNFLGLEFSNDVGYNLDLSWGDWVFLFGYPRGIKQITGGWVSEAPYSGTLAVDAVVRFGFSGGPVFGISKDRAKLLLVGLTKSVPRRNLEFIAPKKPLPMGYQLTDGDTENLIVENEIFVEYGTAYFVSP
ncbi:MAG: serine protease, partial [bacterium]